MSKKTLFLVTGAVVLIVFLGVARAIQVHLQESYAEHQRAEQMAKAQDAMKQLQQQLGAYSQMQQNMPNFANVPNMANMNMPAGNYSPAAQMAMVKLMQKGISPSTAMMLTQAKAQVISQSNTSLRYTLTFPNGVSSDTTLNITPDQKYSPTPVELERARRTGHAIYHVKLSAKAESETKIHLILQYFVPNSEIPVNLLQRIHGQSAADFQIVPSVYADEGNTGAGIAQDTGIEIAKEFLKEHAEHTKYAKELPVPLSRMVDVLNAFKKEEDHIGWLDELAELSECAENPTNPLTQKAYNEDPGAKEQALNSVASSHADVTQASFMRFLNLATSVATDLVDGPLGAITAPVSSYNDEALKGIAEDRINDAKKSVVDCNPYKGYGDIYPPLHGQIEYLYKKDSPSSGDNWKRTNTLEKQIVADVELGFDENGRNKSGVNGTGTFESKQSGGYQNAMGQTDDFQTLTGPVTVYAQLGGSGVVGWIRLDIGGQNLHGVMQHTSTFGQGGTEHSEWDGGQADTTCKFTNVNLRKGGTYSSFSEGEGGYGTCKIVLIPK